MHRDRSAWCSLLYRNSAEQELTRAVCDVSEANRASVNNIVSDKNWVKF